MTAWSIACLIAAMLVPHASAATATSVVPMGMDAGEASQLASLGTSPAYSSYWVGAWMASSGWGGLDNALQSAKAMGTTPLLYWYYWGDSISPTCVESGCNGLSRAQWDSMTQTLASHVSAQMGGAKTFIVLENEFNKNGVDSSSYAPTFDSYLQAKVATLHSVAGVHVVLGFGGWGEGNWGLFPKAIATSDALGFQTMRAETRDTEASYRSAPDRIAQLLTAAQNVGGKGAFLYDLALSSYPDAYWAQVQAQTLANITARESEYASNGLQGIIYRELHDNPNMSPANYYGYAEQHWGLRDGSDTPKPAWYSWAGAYNASAPAPAPAHAPALSASFSGTGGNEWWVQVNVAANQPLSGVCASANGSACTALALQSWGAWAASFHVPNGSLVQFTASAAGGSVTSGKYVWPTGAAYAPIARLTTSASGLNVSADGSASQDASSYQWSWGDGASGSGATATHAYATGGTFVVTLTVSDGTSSSSASANVTLVKPNSPPTASFTATGTNLSWSVDASASSDPDGDALTYAWAWGDGAVGTGVTATHTYANAGTFTVTLNVNDGHATTSTTRTVTATAPPPPPPAAPFTASFSTGGGNAWWVQVAVSANQPLAGVCATVGTGSTCHALTLQSWGQWAASFNVPDGSLVKFTARSSSTGASVTSGSYVWPTGKAFTPVTTTTMSASFSGVSGNAWWVQVNVASNLPLATVCVSVNGGACQKLTLQSWGGWAASFPMPKTATVVFTATSTDGQSVRSGSIGWAI